MNLEIYGYISSIAVLCYLFMSMIFINSEKNKIIKAFLSLLLSMILWTGGSLLMRAQIWPSYIFWYHISFAGILLIVFSYFRFIIAFVGEKKRSLSILYLLLLSLCFIVNIPKGLLLKWPSIKVLDGQSTMVYEEITGFIAVVVIISAIMIVHTMHILFKNYRKNPRLKKQTTPIALGIIVIFLGNIAVLFPFFRGFPIDIVAGVINAFILMYVLIKRNLFKLKMIASETVGYTVCVLIGFSVFYTLLPHIDKFIYMNLGRLKEYYIMIYLVIFTVSISLLFVLWRKVIANIFVKEETTQNEILKKFSYEVSKSLNLKDILKSMVLSITEATGTKYIYVGIKDHDSGDYDIKYSDQSLVDLSFSLRKDNPMVAWIEKNDEYLSMESFVHSTDYKSMWESEKRQMKNLEIAYFIGLKEDSELIGIILISERNKKNRLKNQDISIILSISSVASIAIKNSHTYEKAYLEARTDELTGTLNRRYFYELIQEAFEKNKDGSLALVIINLDDFKLFNQLYGVKQGDIALKNIADIIKRSIGENGYVARYSGKEFALLLPGYDLFSAREITESIRDCIFSIGKDAQNYHQKKITISAGISVAPYGAKSVREMIDNADHAVYQVKRSGKNAIRAFDTFASNKMQLLEELDYGHIYDGYKSTIYALTAAIDAKDHYTFNHSDNVALYSVELAKELNLNKDIIENIRHAALLHDIGKIGIPESILNKPEKLTEEEYKAMQGHVEASIDIIRHLPSLDYVVPAVLGHHERYDGNGYPRRIGGEDIPLTARILCIADSFDAMISKRCYKPDMPVKKVLKILKEEAGRQFDPKLVPIFISIVESGKLEVKDN